MAVRSWQMEFWMIWWFNNIPFNLRSCEKLIHENSQGPKVHCSVMALEPKIEIIMCMWVFRWKCNYVTLYLSSQPHPLPLPRLPWLISWKAKAWGSDSKWLCWSKCPYKKLLLFHLVQNDFWCNIFWSPTECPRLASILKSKLLSENSVK